MEKPDILSRNSTRPKTGLFLTGKTRHFEPKLNTPENRTIPEWKNPFFSQYHNKGKTLIIFFFYFPSVAEMMIGATMMKVIQTLTTCTNMMNIHILKSYSDATLVPNISSMHAFSHKHAYNTNRTQVHVMLHPSA
jgi:hypothetical protein